MLLEIDNLVDNDGVFAFCRNYVNTNIRQDDWRELYITSIERFNSSYIVKYGVVLDNDEEYFNTVRIKGV